MAATSAPSSSWPRALRAALNATAAMLPLMLGWAVITYGALGPAGAQVGLTAAAVAVVIGSFVNLAISRAPMPAAASSSSAALLLGACVMRLLQDEAFLRPGTGVVMLLAAASAVVIVSGVLMVLLGWMRAGVLVRYVPQPVLAGFMNGIAVLMVMAQLPVIFGAGPGWPTALAATAALATAAIVAWIQWRWRGVPATLSALVLGSLLAIALQSGCAAWVPGAGAAACTLSTMSGLEVAAPRWDGLAALGDAATWAVLSRHALTLATTALLLAGVGAMESALNIAQLDLRLNRRTDPNREFVALGAANIASGALAGLPIVYLRLRAIAVIDGGGQGARPEWLSNLLVVAALVVALPLFANVPLAVVAGIVCMLAWALVDRWTRALLAQWRRGAKGAAGAHEAAGAAEAAGAGGAHAADGADGAAGGLGAEGRWSLAIVAAVCVTTAAAGLAAGVAAGVLLAMLLFTRAMNRSLVRLRYSAAQIASRRVYPEPLEAQLAAQRASIAVIELEGALFFGNVERLDREAEQAARGCTHLVLDLRRVSALDASGAMTLAQLRDRLARAGTVLLLAGVTADNRHGRMMHSQGVLGLEAGGATPRWKLFADADHAIEAAEAALLGAAGMTDCGGIGALELPVAQLSIFEGLTAPQLARLQARLLRRELGAGERLFAEGDPGHSIFVLLKGSVSVLDRARGQRFVSFSAGMCFGETAVLDGRGRSADARADTPSTVLEMPAAVLAELERDEPAVAARIYRNLAQHLSERLRAASMAWRFAAG